MVCCCVGRRGWARANCAMLKSWREPRSKFLAVQFRGMNIWRWLEFYQMGLSPRDWSASRHHADWRSANIHSFRQLPYGAGEDPATMVDRIEHWQPLNSLQIWRNFAHYKTRQGDCHGPSTITEDFRIDAIKQITERRHSITDVL